jgi:hypothetical protein
VSGSGNREHRPAGGSGEVEHTRWSPGLIGFYLSCAGVSLGAAITFGSHFFFRNTGGTWFGIVMTSVSSVTCFLALRAARRPPPS